MSRRKRKDRQASPSLFPFLAVLICTMGAIIVLLVLVVKNADVQADVASQTHRDEVEQKKTDLRDRLEVERDLVDSLKELRPELKERLEDSKALVGHLADHISRLREENERLTQQAARLENAAADSHEANQVQARIQELKRKIADATDRLQKKQQEISRLKPSYAIVPASSGGSGTFRRPIFVECSWRGVTLQPYGINLVADDFPSNLGPNNPLDVALLMIRDYWNQLDPDRRQGQPYPLLVVRPSGARAFAAARKAMKSWTDEFGYELITEDLELTYPPADEAFRERLLTAIENARTRQEQLLAAIGRQKVLEQIRRLDSQRGSTGYRASSVNGGFVRESSGQGPSGIAENHDRPMGGNPSRTGFASVKNETLVGNGLGSRKNHAVGGSRFPPDPNNSQDRGSNANGSVPARDSGFKPANQLVRETPSNAKSNALGTAGLSGPGTSGSPSGANSPLGQSLPAESLARTRGKDWALPSKSRNSIQVRKPIKIELNRDNVRIVEIGKGVRTIPFDGSTASAIPEMIEQIWKQIDAWGIAGVNSYWKPELNLYVAPDANGRFEDLRILLSGSGLDLRKVKP